MATKVFDPASLAPILLNTGVQQSDPRMYQFLNALISGLSIIKSSGGFSGGSSVTNITEIINRFEIPGQDGTDGGDSIIMIGSSGSGQNMAQVMARVVLGI